MWSTITLYYCSPKLATVSIISYLITSYVASFTIILAILFIFVSTPYSFSCSVTTFYQLPITILTNNGGVKLLSHAGPRLTKQADSSMNSGGRASSAPTTSKILENRNNFDYVTVRQKKKEVLPHETVSTTNGGTPVSQASIAPRRHPLGHPMAIGQRCLV